MRRLPLLVCLLALPALAQVQVPADVSLGPATWWFYGPLLNERGAVPHFGLMFDVYAIIDQELIAANRDRIPPKYQAMADKVTEARIGPSIFIPNALYLSPRVDPLRTGMFGLSWRPLALTLVSTGKKQPGSWQKSKGRLDLDAGLLVTVIYVYSIDALVPDTLFLRPGIDLKLSIEGFVTDKFLVSLGGGIQAYVPQKMGGFGFGPLNEMMSFAAFTFLKCHYRFPYNAKL